jgi:uncharacterized membrane protein
MMIRKALLGLGVATIALIAIADEIDKSKIPAVSGKKDVSYEKDIKPIFDKSCVKCHSGERPKARLRLDTHENILAGRRGEKVLEAGKSADSVLVHGVSYLGEEEHWMPPPKNKDNIARLTAEEVGLIRAWIDQGAKH